MLKLAICDDSTEFLNTSKQLLHNWSNRPCEFTVTCFSDGDSLLKAHQLTPFDIIFLDVVMPMLNGIEVAREIRQQDNTAKIVFLTSSSEYAVDSYTVKASNYLLKPLNPDSFYRCLKELFDQLFTEEPSLFIKGLSKVHRVYYHEIEYVEAQNKRVAFFLADGRVLISGEPLYVYENKLAAAKEFFKCHRSYILNLQQISNYTQKEVQMRSGFRIPISRNCHKDFETAYFSLIFEKAGETPW